MTEYHMVKKTNSDLKKAAREIFGSDVVKNAWLIGEYVTYGSSSQEQNNKNKNFVNERMKQYIKEIGNQKKIDQLDISGQTVMIEFVSGKFVTFNSSEWGWIKKSSQEEINAKG